MHVGIYIVVIVLCTYTYHCVRKKLFMRHLEVLTTQPRLIPQLRMNSQLN